MKFNTLFVFKEDRFCIGQEAESKKYFLAIPVFNGIVEYEEYYEISQEEFNLHTTDMTRLKELAQKCREQKNDAQLMVKPGSKRGSAI